MDWKPDIYPLLVEQAPDAIVFADREGTIRVWNESAAALFGYAPEEAIGRSLDLIIPEHLRRAHWEGFHQAIARGHTKLGRQALKTRAIPKNGQKLYVSLAFAVVKDREGNAVGAMATAREFVESGKG
jgi:PAS domain S-box-containing protein